MRGYTAPKNTVVRPYRTNISERPPPVNPTATVMSKMSRTDHAYRVRIPIWDSNSRRHGRRMTPTRPAAAEARIKT